MLRGGGGGAAENPSCLPRCSLQVVFPPHDPLRLKPNGMKSLWQKLLHSIRAVLGAPLCMLCCSSERVDRPLPLYAPESRFASCPSYRSPCDTTLVLNALNAALTPNPSALLARCCFIARRHARDTNGDGAGAQ